MESSETGFVLGKEHMIPVRVPHPARFALHKLIVSTLRTASHALKADKDRRQAAVLIDALAQTFPDWLDDAAAALDDDARARVARAASVLHRTALDLSMRARDFVVALIEAS